VFNKKQEQELAVIVSRSGH